MMWLQVRGALFFHEGSSFSTRVPRLRADRRPTSVLIHTTPSGQVLTLATMHEIENARSLVEMALSRVQLKH